MYKKIYYLVGLLLLLSATPATKTWVALGDSITYLNDHQDETGHRIKKGYMTLVTEKLRDYKYINHGYNGWTAMAIAESIETLGLQKADVYTVFLGTNDWWRGNPLGSINDYTNNSGGQTVMGSFRIILDKLKSLNGAAKIILITPMPRVDFVYINNFTNNAHGSYKGKNNQTLSQFAQGLVDIAKHEQLDVVDLHALNEFGFEKLVKYKRLREPSTGMYKNYSYPEYLDVPFDPVKDEYPYPVKSMDMTYDGLHPSDKGYQVISKKLIPLFKS